VREVTLEMTENEALTLVFALNNQDKKSFIFHRDMVHFGKLSDKISKQVIEQNK